MDRRLSIVLAFAAVAIGSITVPRAQLIQSPVSCLHDATERQTDRARRDEALLVAKAINAAEGALAQQTRRYHQLSDLQGLPQVPAGFELRLYADTSGYVLSLKDVKDSCHYGLFSDQSGWIYEKSPLTAPAIAQAHHDGLRVK